MIAPAAVMVNLLGAGRGSGRPAGSRPRSQSRRARPPVWQGDLRPGRKMGHVTALGATLDEALATAQRAADQLRFGAGEA